MRNAVLKIFVGVGDESKCTIEALQMRLRTDTVDAARFYERVGYSARGHATATHERFLGSDLEAS